MTSLHLGCGPNNKLGDVGVDILPGPAVDIVHDLNVVPWPLPSAAYDRVICIDVIEHLQNVVSTINEIHRVGRPGARVTIQVPTTTSRDFFTDPTHVRGFGYRSFDYFVEGKPLSKYGYSENRFTLQSAQFFKHPSRLFGLLDRAMIGVANRYPDLYETRLGFVCPMSGIRFELEVVK
jgi:predicted SAM-dependent methyltransferase